jgi:AAA domain
MTPANAPYAIWDRELAASEKPKSDWLWHGFLARGNITLLTSLWKSGKTTLISQLLARRKAAGDFVGAPLTPGKSVVISEEGSAVWADRCRTQDYGGNVCFFPQPFNHVPSADEWRSLLDQIAALNQEHGADLLIVDPLAHFLRTETDAHTILETLFPLRTLTALGMAVLLLHHPKKGQPLAGQSGRGHGSLLGHVDISIEMRHAGADPDTRARRFFALSRHAETPRHFLFERAADATNYVRLPDTQDDDFQQHWDILRMVLEDATHKLTRQQILDDWPADYAKPDAGTLWRWLTRAVALSLIATDGTGHKNSPFRYWLPQSEARWKKDAMYVLREQREKDREVLRGVMGEAPSRRSKLPNTGAGLIIRK